MIDKQQTNKHDNTQGNYNIIMSLADCIPYPLSRLAGGIFCMGRLTMSDGFKYEIGLEVTDCNSHKYLI